MPEPELARAWRSGAISGSQVQALVPLVLATGSEPWHAAWLERAARFTLRRLEDDVDHVLASGRFDPALLPDLAELPEGVQIGAEHMGGQETDGWVGNVPADVARLFRACLCTVARRLDTGPGAALEAMFDHCSAPGATSAAFTPASPRA
ncbi:MAG: hypothetical protein ACREI8_15780 [Myxococcota bacterium]